MNPSNGSSLLTSKSNSTLRPRTRRLISVEDDIYATDGSESGLSRNASRTGSRTGSRVSTSTSKSSAASSSRFNGSSKLPAPFETSSDTLNSRQARNTSNAFTGIWGNSWSAIQGIAVNVIGGGDGSGGVKNRQRKPIHGQRTSASAPPPKQWGPPASGISSQIGTGTQEEREAMVRAMKRKDLLTASEHLVTDSVGRIKRRNSDDRTSASAPPCENEDRDALVYVHHVKPRDTLAGLSIRYSCEQAVLRKSNRMWPNDSVQTKKTIVLPVDACGVKGRPVQGPDVLPDEDMLLGEFGTTDSTAVATVSDELPNGWDVPTRKDIESTSSNSSNAIVETPWKHDSWVLLPNDKRPTQIGRMPRRALGYFPPARRKSVAHLGTSTPRASTDLPRSSTSTTPIVNSSPQPARPRASSNLSTFLNHHVPRNAAAKSWGLHGPGGVGTMGRNVRGPGPAQDGLNKNFAQYLPSVAPPPEQEYFTPWAPSLLDAGAGTSSPHGTGMDFQDIGGAIEGWMRKVGTQAQKLLTEPGIPGQGKRSAVPVLGAVGGDLGDLIELRDDAFEIGDDERERGRPRSCESANQIGGQLNARPNINLVLRDRGRQGDGAKKD